METSNWDFKQVEFNVSDCLQMCGGKGREEEGALQEPEGDGRVPRGETWTLPGPVPVGLRLLLHRCLYLMR